MKCQEMPTCWHGRAIIRKKFCYTIPYTNALEMLIKCYANAFEMLLTANEMLGNAYLLAQQSHHLRSVVDVARLVRPPSDLVLRKIAEFFVKCV